MTLEQLRIRMINAFCEYRDSRSIFRDDLWDLYVAAREEFLYRKHGIAYKPIEY